MLSGQLAARSTVSQVTAVPVWMPRKMKATALSQSGMPTFTPAKMAMTPAIMLPASQGAGMPASQHRVPPAAPMRSPCSTGIKNCSVHG